MAIPPPVVAGVAAGLLYSALTGEKKRSRADWEAQFDIWTKPSSTTEEKRIEATENAVRQLISSVPELDVYGIRIIPQGSSVNNTNTRNQSDLDLVLVAENEFWTRPAPGQSLPQSFPGTGVKLADAYPRFRNLVFDVLKSSEDHLLTTVETGNKALKLNPLSDARVECDVVPAFRLQQLKPPGRATLLGGDADHGIIFIAKNGDKITSFPEQHLSNGRLKNVRTGNRYKYVVRVLKKMRILVETDPIYEHPSSYQIECLVYNVPDSILTQGSLYEATALAVDYLRDKLRYGPACNYLVQVHGVYSLFEHWSASLLDLFTPNEVLQCRRFLDEIASEIATD